MARTNHETATPHLPLDALLRTRQRGQFEENWNSTLLEDRADEPIENGRGLAGSERRPSGVPASLDSALTLGAFRDLTNPLTGGPRSESRVNLLLAAEWLFSTLNQSYLLSFPSVCARLELDPIYIAEGALRRLDSQRVELIRRHFERAGLKWLREPTEESAELSEAA